MFKYLDKNGLPGTTFFGKKMKRVNPAPLFFVKKSGAGFTIIEILFVTAIMATLVMVGFINYSSFQKRTELSTAANEVVAVLHLANVKTISSEDDMVYSVHFEVDSYTLFSSSTYDPLADDNIVYNLPSSVEFYEMPAGDNIIFSRITGETTTTGDVVLRLISDNTQTKTIAVLPSGRAGFSGEVNLTDSRIIDSRHVHFDLGWSIQDRNTLTLNFLDPPNPDVIYNIDMTDYFEEGGTVFDWSDTLDVNGVDQELRIHTHFFDDFE